MKLDAELMNAQVKIAELEEENWRLVEVVCQVQEANEKIRADMMLFKNIVRHMMGGKL